MSPPLPGSRTNSPAAVIDPAFRAITKGTSAFLIWRIEKLQVVPVPKEQYGSFYNGDSYVIYSATDRSDTPGVNVKVHELRGQADLRVHFWLGENTSQDEAGVAAIKTIELDDLLGGSPIQHREVQESESERFRSYFASGIRYLEGGVASGLNTFDGAFKPKLPPSPYTAASVDLSAREMREISWQSMNEGDVFVLDTGAIIFVWNGKQANKYEKVQGSKIAQKLRTEHGGGNVVVVDDGAEDKLPADELKVFEDHLSLGKKQLATLSRADSNDDTLHEKVAVEKLKLYRCSDADGAFKVLEVKTGPLVQADLDSKDSFIVDNHASGIWVWIGKKATTNERTEALRNAQGFISKKGYPKGTPIVRVIDGGEPVEFKGLFQTWTDRDQITGPTGKAYSNNRIAQTVQTKFDAVTLHENRALAAQSQMVDDGTGKRDIWRVENFDLVPLDVKSYGYFYGGDCYVILYTYKSGTSERHIIYYWLGRKSTQDEQGTAALKTVEMDNKLGGGPVQVRVVQGKEPPHFMAMFGGQMVIFEGGKASGFANANQEDKQEKKESHLLHIRGTSRYDTKAVEVPKKASSLNSNDVFALTTKNAVYLWSGKGSTGDEREAAKRIASSSARDPVIVFEGSEKPDFWEAIGGKEPYSSEKRLQEAAPDRTPRLFHCSNASGRFNVEELIDFNQDDLVPDDVLLLDSGDALFLWIGNGANAEERKKADDMAQEYLQTDPKGRDDSTPIIKIAQGYEPPNFTGFFGVWDQEMWAQRESGDGLGKLPPKVGKNRLSSQTSINGQAKYPLSVLRNNWSSTEAPDLPDGVDPSSREAYLLDSEFQEVFKMTYSEFSVLPAWKKAALKKSAGLF
ncbi:Villin-1 [Hypsibius exemplaris]|uniref:Villin-1 n=1 Tax=Hypsibius exemplaris TaxID=2072580 RepID=A0A1W0WVC0_HYPEX|nr:Villin-1 [Hypsibius exemplaris]